MAFYGLWAPILTWTDPMSNETTPAMANYWAEYIASPEDTGLELTCSLSFSPPPDGSLPDDDSHTVYNRNAPDFVDECSVTLDVLCKLVKEQATCVSGVLGFRDALI